MKKNLTILSLAIIFSISAINVYAVSNKASDQGKQNGSISNEKKSEEHGKSEEHKKNEEESEAESEEPTTNPTVNPSEDSENEDECLPAKNHGQYVSCIAKTHQGGKVTSEAARSDIGKKEKDDETDPSVTPEISPEVTASIAPTGVLSPTPSATVTPDLTPVPLEENAEEENLGSQLQSLIDELKGLIDQLKNLINLGNS